jgi:hypothetical protein
MLILKSVTPAMPNFFWRSRNRGSSMDDSCDQHYRGNGMAILRTSLSVALASFPEHTDKIKRLFRESERFQSLCEDYRRCAEASKYWNQSASEEASARSAEYGNLLQGLAEEIMQNLNESK